MARRLPIHDKLDDAFKTIRACLKELGPIYELNVGQNDIILWETEGASATAIPDVTNSKTLVEYMNKVAAN